MIYTVTFNPAVDYVVHTGQLIAGAVNRSKKEEFFFGGKGINVSIILNRLGMDSVAMGFIAGFTGEAIKEGIEGMGIKTDFVQLEKGYSRINVKIRTRKLTEINGQGPEISERDIDELFRKLDRITDGDVIVLAGSIPGTLPADMYERILARYSDRKIMAVVDASNQLMLNVLKYNPFLIKPNNFELGEIFGVKVETYDDAVLYAGKLKEMGARNVLVSMAEKGSVLLDESGDIHICKACEGIAQNTVGAGDSMVAGFIAGFIESHDFDYAMKLGTAAGGATAFSDDLGSRRDILRLMNELAG